MTADNNGEAQAVMKVKDTAQRARIYLVSLQGASIVAVVVALVLNGIGVGLDRTVPFMTSVTVMALILTALIGGCHRKLNSVTWDVADEQEVDDRTLDDFADRCDRARSDTMRDFVIGLAIICLLVTFTISMVMMS